MHIGQHVRCIDDHWPVTPRDDRRRGVQYPVRGTVYTIRDIVPSPTGSGATNLLLTEIRNPVIGYRSRGRPIGRHERSFGAVRFKPLAKLRVEDFLTEKQPLENV